jgi:mono/diheme cytochrome c family protein
MLSGVRPSLWILRIPGVPTTVAAGLLLTLGLSGAPRAQEQPQQPPGQQGQGQEEADGGLKPLETHRGNRKVRYVFRVPAPPPELVAKGKVLFAARCVRCHGPDGDGNGPEAARLDPRPRDLRQGHYKLRSTEAGTPPLDSDLERTILRGIPGTAMQGNPLSAQQLKELVAFVKTLRLPTKPSRFRLEPPGDVPEVPRAPKLTWAMAAKGRQLFRVFRCWRCHGMSGKGDGINARRMKDRIGHRTLPADLNRRPFKSGDKPEDIFRLIVTGMDYTPMPPWPADRLALLPEWPDEDYAGLTAEQLAQMRAFMKSEPSVDPGPPGRAPRKKLGTERVWELVSYVYSLRHLESARLSGPRPKDFARPAAP